MRNKNLDYILGAIIGILILTVSIISSYNDIDYLIFNWEAHKVFDQGYVLAIYIISAIANISLAVYCLGFVIYNFIKRNAEITYRGSLIGLGANSAIAGFMEIIVAIVNSTKDDTFNPYSYIINGALVILTGAGLIYAAVTKYAAKGRSMAMSMSMVLSVLYVISIVATIARYKTFNLSMGADCMLLVSFIIMSLIAYKRKTFVVYY